jgi:hypothetical protein
MATVAIDDTGTAVSTARQRDDDIETVAGLSPRGDRSKKFRIDPMARGTFGSDGGFFFRPIVGSHFVMPLLCNIAPNNHL